MWEKIQIIINYLKNLQQKKLKTGQKKIIDNEISKINLKENIIVWRYTHKKLFKLIFENHKIKVGYTFTDKAFIDTTLVADLLNSFAFDHKYNCLLKLYLPKGTKGTYVDFYDKYSILNECEFLLLINKAFMLKKKVLALDI